MMNQECICDSSSEYTEEKNEETEQELLKCNRIFLNFSREFHNSAKENYRTVKVKDLFKYLSERQDLQEMKVSGWLDEGKQEEEFAGEEEEEQEEEDEDDDLDSRGEVDCRRNRGGQRFAMSRDFWYRKLNTLKAQKLDEVALEAKDLPPDDSKKDPKYLKGAKTEKVFSSDVPEDRREVFDEINHFDRTVGKPVEKILKKGFVNVYDNRRYFRRDCN